MSTHQILSLSNSEWTESCYILARRSNSTTDKLCIWKCSKISTWLNITWKASSFPLLSLHQLSGAIYLHPSMILAPWAPSKLLWKHTFSTPPTRHPVTPRIHSFVTYGANKRNIFDWLIDFTHELYLFIFICPIACSMGQIIKSVCVSQSVCQCVYRSASTLMGRISWSIFTKTGTDEEPLKKKTTTTTTTPSLFCPPPKHPF